MIPEDQIRSLLADRLGSPVLGLQPAAGGQISESYFASTADGDFVIRFVTPDLSDTLHKDRYVCERLAPPGVPVPEFMCVDDCDAYTFAITRRAPGKGLQAFAGQDYRALVPDIVATLDRIHQTSLEQTTGWASFDRNGSGRSGSWQEFLLAVADEEEEGDEDCFYGHWHHFFEDSFLERDLFDAIHAEMKRLLPCCPEVRTLVHGDYGFDNILAQDGKITAVIDWANALFGDYLWDVAWLDFGYEHDDYAERFRDFYREQRRTVSHFDERLRCYYCHIALDSFKYYAKTGQPDGYRQVKTRIAQLLDAPGEG